MYSGVISILESSSSVISLFSSKSIANGSIPSSPLLRIAARVKYLYNAQCPHALIVFFNFWRKCGMLFLCAEKRTRYHVSVSWIMTTQAFILHSHKKTILVVKIIVSLQNSPHHHLQTTFKDAEFIMLIYFLFIASHFSTLYYNIQRYFLFSLRTFH